MQLTFSSSNWWVLFISLWESEKWSKVCKLSLLCPLLSSNYLSTFTVLPIQLPCSNPMAVPRSVLGSLIGPRLEMLRNLLLCDNIIASIRAYWHIVTLFWAEPHCSFFETTRSVQNALWKSAGAGHHQLLTAAVEQAGWLGTAAP